MFEWREWEGSLEGRRLLASSLSTYVLFGLFLNIICIKLPF